MAIDGALVGRDIRSITRPGVFRDIEVGVAGILDAVVRSAFVLRPSRVKRVVDVKHCWEVREGIL
jgi:hypothetical protein